METYNPVRDEFVKMVNQDIMRKAEEIAWEEDKDEAFADFIETMVQEGHFAPKTLAKETGVSLEEILSVLSSRNIVINEAELKEEMDFYDRKKAWAWELWRNDPERVLWSLAITETKYEVTDALCHSLVKDERLSVETIAKILDINVDDVKSVKGLMNSYRSMGLDIEGGKKENLERCVIRALEDKSLPLSAIPGLFGMSLEEVVALKEREGI